MRFKLETVIADKKIDEQKANKARKSLQEFFDKVDAAGTGLKIQGCHDWVINKVDVSSFKDEKGILEAKGVTWDYIYSVWTTGWFSNTFVGGHAAIEIRIGNDLYYFDNGWWGPIFKKDRVPFYVQPGLSPPTIIDK